MSEELYLCQKEIRRLRGVVRTYEAQMRELEGYLEQMESNNTLGDEANIRFGRFLIFGARYRKVNGKEHSFYAEIYGNRFVRESGKNHETKYQKLSVRF